MSGFLQALMSGTRGIELAYGVTLAGMLFACIRARAPWMTLLLTPFFAAPVFLIAALSLPLISPLLRDLGIGPFSLGRVIFGALFCAGAGNLAGRQIVARSASAVPSYHRGAIVSAQPAAGRADPDNPDAIRIAGVPVKPEDETKHFKLIGTTGTGKSTAIQELLAAALARGDRAIIADPDSGYLRRFYEPDRDVILNPFDGDARKWDLFGEIIHDYDVDHLARSLIPDSGSLDRSWNEYARIFFSALVQQAIRAGTPNDVELYRLIKSASVAELRMLLGGTAAGPFLDEGNEKMFGSIRSIASSATRPLEYTTRQLATPLSVRQWVRQGAARHAGGNGGVLFLPYSAGEIAALRSMISAWMRLGIFEAMELDEGDQRLWFVVDELDALGAIDGLKDALARLRKFGGRCVLGFQSIGQVSATYDKGTAETIVENCGNTLILRCSASEHGGTAEFASKLIGQREVLHTTRSRTRKPTDWMASTTTSRQLRTEPAVMASEVERLPDLTGYLKIASNPDWLAVKLTPITETTKPRQRKPAILAPDPAAAPSPPVPPTAELSTRAGSQGVARPRRARTTPPPANRRQPKAPD